MVRSDLSDARDGSAIERTAVALDVGPISHVARAVLAVGGDPVVYRWGQQAATIAAVRVADRRAGDHEIDPEGACEPFDVDPDAVARAERLLVERLDAPAPDETIVGLRRAAIGVREVLVAADNGRAVAPRLPKSVVDAEPALAAISGRPLERVKLSVLRAHLRRLEADLEVARLGVDLYAAVQDA